jgi:hypothetical protein
MAGFNRFKELVDTQNDVSRIFTWRKSPSQASQIGVWFDMSMSPGNPVPQYYASAPMESVQMKQSTLGGIYHGAPVSPATKYIRQTLSMTSTTTSLPMTLLLCDYLLYYPFVDESIIDEQFVTNTVSLPRYTDGKGVKIMAVSVAPRTGGQSFTVKYCNELGVEDRVTVATFQNTASANGSIVTTFRNGIGFAGPFLPLQDGDKGVRYIQSVKMNGADVGLFSLVLVKPLCQTQIRGIDAPVEVDYFKDQGGVMPQIEDDAYLNYINLPSGSGAATTYYGALTVTWN